MKYQNLKTFKNWARAFVSYQENKGQKIDSIDFETTCIVRLHTESGLLVINPESIKNPLVITGIEKNAL